MAEELDDTTWDLLDDPGQSTNDMGLGMLLKMTRCHDLGLGQLFFPDLDLGLDSDETANEGDDDAPSEGKWADTNDPLCQKEKVVEVLGSLRLEDAGAEVSAAPTP